jgi:hypothetical protein
VLGTDSRDAKQTSPRVIRLSTIGHYRTLGTDKIDDHPEATPHRTVNRYEQNRQHDRVVAAWLSNEALASTGLGGTTTALKAYTIMTAISSVCVCANRTRSPPDEYETVQYDIPLLDHHVLPITSQPPVHRGNTTLALLIYYTTYSLPSHMHISQSQLLIRPTETTVPSGARDKG